VVTAVGDMDRPETLPAALAGVDTIFLGSPIDEHVELRETNVIAAAEQAGVARVVKLYSAVKHHDDPPDRLHRASIAALERSGMEWALVSPNSVLEESIASFAEMIHSSGAIWACGEGKVGLVAADDVARAASVVLTERRERGRNYEISGPQA